MERTVEIRSGSGVLRALGRLNLSDSYRPSRSLGGVGGLLDFSSDRIDDLIALGYEDTRHHDCETSWCVLPGAEPPEWLRHGWIPPFLW